MKMTELLPSLERAISHLRAVAIASFYIYLKKCWVCCAVVHNCLLVYVYTVNSLSRSQRDPLKHFEISVL